MNKYHTTIGLEIHAELLTQTKMFCSSKNDTNEVRPNTNVCPVCMGHPGTLPIINKEAVKNVLKVGVALGGELADYTEFDRKNYFYPDIPKGYQISQYKHPLVKGGVLCGVNITRIHLEEDTARSTHDRGDMSLVDFNRAGVPLMELVTEPVINDAETAANFARELQLLLKYLKVSNANMEMGEMRVEANISVSKDKDIFGTKVEVKNLNSFKAVEKAIKYEVIRQIDLLEKGGSVKQETRGWDENKQETFSQRAKEESHDYRYFPDPDLPKLIISEIEDFDKIKLVESLPELPWEKRDKYTTSFGLSQEAADLYTRDIEKGQYIDKVYELLSDKKLANLASNYLSSVLGITNIKHEHFVSVIEMISENLLSARGAKEIFKKLETTDTDPKKLANELGLIQKNNTEELTKLAEKIIIENPKAVEEYKSGKLSSIQFLIGQAIKQSGGSVNPAIIKEVFEKLIQ